MAGKEKRVIKVFIASPGDLAVERRAFRNQIDLLNLGFGDGAAVTFEAMGWEDTLAVTGRRAQAAINKDIDECDVFVLALHRRWGQESPDAAPYTSYTEEEFHRALSRWERTGKPDVFVFFKNVDAASIADPGEQLQKVLKFRRQLEETRKVLYRFFEDEKGFAGEVDKHLRAYARGELPKADAAREIVLLPLEYVKAVEAERAKAKRAVEVAEKAKKMGEAAAARAEELALAMAEGAAKAAREGRLEEAKAEFGKAVAGTASLRVLYLAYSFYRRTGDLGEAERIIERWLAISGAETESADTAAAYGNLGLIYQTRGELEKAEEMHRKSLAIDEKLGRVEGMAVNYGNLGLIYRTRGELEKAQEMHRKALAIDEKLGRLEGMATNYGNLGAIHWMRGELEKAEEIHRKALAIAEKLGRVEGMANAYGYLGVIYQTRGELEKAEEMHRKSLAINEKLGRLEGMAADYGNLGLIYRTRGELEKAEEMLRKSLAIEEKLGRLEGMAANYANLGSVRKRRGDLAGAREWWGKSRELFAKIGLGHRVKEVEGWLAGLGDVKGRVKEGG